MAKGRAPDPPASNRLQSLLEHQATLQTRARELGATISAADFAQPGTFERVRRERGELRATEDTLAAIAPQIRTATSELQAEASQEREAQLLALRSKEAGELQPIVKASLELKAALAGWDAFVMQERALGGAPFLVVPAQVGWGVEVGLQHWRQMIPEALGLPRKLTRLEEQQADAVLQAEQCISLWVAADSSAQATRNSNVRVALAKRAEECLVAIDRARARCVKLGVAAPPMPTSLMSQLAAFLERVFQRDQNEAQLLSPTVAEGEEARSEQARAMDLADLRRP